MFKHKLTRVTTSTKRESKSERDRSPISCVRRTFVYFLFDDILYLFDSFRFVPFLPTFVSLFLRVSLRSFESVFVLFNRVYGRTYVSSCVCIDDDKREREREHMRAYEREREQHEPTKLR